jgi:hypothetical protein
MPTPAKSNQCVLRIHQAEDGRFETRNVSPAESLIGVDVNFIKATGTARREADLRASQGVKVTVQVKRESSWHDVYTSQAK